MKILNTERKRGNAILVLVAILETLLFVVKARGMSFGDASIMFVQAAIVGFIYARLLD